MPEPDVIMIHNRYLQRGGEDDVFAAEAALLSGRGHRVVTYIADNRSVPGMRRLALARATLWNAAVYRDLRALCHDVKPAVVHFHNPFPLVSPAGYYAARSAGAAVVQTLHNFRLVCPNAMLFRAGRVCEDCVGRRIAWPAVLHACYRGDRSATAVSAAMLGVHRALGTWRQAVDCYVALTDFSRRAFVRAGIASAQIVVKPNFLEQDPGVGAHRGGFALYAGRLTPEKGVATMLRAWERLGGRPPLKIAGAGPLERAWTPRGVEWLGWQSPDRVLALMQEAAVLVLPSEWYEGFPVTLVQAFATGLPAIVTGHGSLAELVQHGRTGRHVREGDAADLAAAVESALSDADALAAMGRRARAEFEARYTAERNYEQLLGIYDLAARRRAAGRAGAA